MLNQTRRLFTERITGLKINGKKMLLYETHSSQLILQVFRLCKMLLTFCRLTRIDLQLFMSSFSCFCKHPVKGGRYGFHGALGNRAVFCSLHFCCVLVTLVLLRLVHILPHPSPSRPVLSHLPSCRAQSRPILSPRVLSSLVWFSPDLIPPHPALLLL